MLSPEDNKTLTSVGPETIMGKLLRRYWTPALLAAELPEADGAAPPRPPAGRGPRRLPRHRGQGRSLRPGLPPPRRVDILRSQRGSRSALRLPRLEVRHDRRLRRHAIRARREQLQEQGAHPRLPHARVRWHRLGLHGPGGDHAALPRPRHRSDAGWCRTCRQADHILQLDPGPRRQHRYLAHLLASRLLRPFRHAGRRHGQARLPLAGEVVVPLDPGPRPAAGGRRHLLRLQVRRHPHHAERPHPRPRHALDHALPDHRGRHADPRRRHHLRAPRRRDLLALHGELRHAQRAPSATKRTHPAARPTSSLTAALPAPVP